MPIAPVLLFLAVLIGIFALAYCGAWVYKRYKEAQWETSVKEMEAQEPTEDEKDIGDEWMPGCPGCKAESMKGTTSGTILTENEVGPLPSNFTTPIPEGVKVEFDVKELETEVKKDLTRFSNFMVEPPRVGKTIDYNAIPAGVDFIDDDGIRYCFVQRHGKRQKIRSYKSFVDGGSLSEKKGGAWPSRGDLEKISEVDAKKGTEWVGAWYPTSENFIPRLVQQILNNGGDLLAFYRNLPIKELALHIHEANAAGRQRVEEIQKRLKADEAAIRRAADEQIKALHAKNYDELEKTKPGASQYMASVSAGRPVLEIQPEVFMTYDKVLEKVEKQGAEKPNRKAKSRRRK